MGFDISNHPVDTRLIMEELIPALVQGAVPDLFLDRAASLSAVAHKANQWGLRATRLDHLITEKQWQTGPKRILRRQKKRGLLKRLFGEIEFEEYAVLAKTSGLPGFDSELCVWGRPFFIVADTVEESLAAYEQYLECGDSGLCAVDSLARTMYAKLEAKRHRLPKDLHPAVVAALDSFYPILDHLPELDEEEAGTVSVVATRDKLASMLRLSSEAWAHRNSGASIEDDSLDEPVPAMELASSTPYVLLNLAAQVLPGWMGRGRVWPTAMFEKIGVRVSHVFETPTSLFEPLVRAFPAIEEGFSTSIVDNYSLGGYVRPEKVGALGELLQKHQRDLILAWSEDNGVSSDQQELLAADYKKILEPVTLAERKGFGFIEAAEVYSGFMGVMN